MAYIATASQTVGPFFHLGLDKLCVTDLAGAGTGGRIAIQGRVLDGDGKPVPDALIEVWQAGPDGRHGQPGFRGFGRTATDDGGGFRFTTLKPGSVAGPERVNQAPHLAVAVFMRGLLRHLVTRMYFPGEAANEQDPILALVPAERRGTLVARDAGDGTLAWDIVLQGPDETVFFDC